MKRWLSHAAALVGAVVGTHIFFCDAAFATPGDYDGDGLADIAIIDADQPEDKTTVFVRQSSNSSVRAFVFHPFGNAVIAGDFYGNGKTYPGIVSIVEVGQPLEWRIKRPNGRTAFFTFGQRGDKIPNQGDLDCDGKTDYVLVRNSSGNTRTWYAKLSSNPSVEATTVFGAKGNFIFTADVDGDGCSEIGVLSSDYVWSSRPFSGDEDDVTEFQWGAPGDFPLLPADIDGDDVPEYIVARKVGKKQVAFTHALNNTETQVNLGPTDSVPMVGNFFGSNTFGWFDRNNSRTVLITTDSKRRKITYGNPRRGLVRPDGTEVAEGKSGRFGSPSS